MRFARIQILVGMLYVASATQRAHGSVFSMVPVLAIGFDDLRQRVDGQSKQAAEQQKGLMVCSVLEDRNSLLTRSYFRN